jgi:hypothetical protein
MPAQGENVGTRGKRTLVTRPLGACLILLAAGALTGLARGAAPTPDPAPVAKPKAKPTSTAGAGTQTRTSTATTTSRDSRTVTPTQSSTPSRSTGTSTTRTTPSSSTPRPATTRHATTSTRAKSKQPVPKAHAKPKAALGATATAKGKTEKTPAASPHVVSATPSSGLSGTSDLSEPSKGRNDLARTLLLTLAALFLVLAAVPWRPIFQYQVGPDQVLRWRVAFAVISVSVGIGYVIATTMNGAA